MVTIEEVRSFATRLPRTTEALVHGRLKFRVGRIVYLAFSGGASVDPSGRCGRVADATIRRRAHTAAHTRHTRAHARAHTGGPMRHKDEPLERCTATLRPQHGFNKGPRGDSVPSRGLTETSVSRP